MKKNEHAPRPPSPIQPLPLELCEGVIKLLGSQATQNEESAKALARLLDRKSMDLAKAYRQLASKHDLPTIASYWASAYRAYLDLEVIALVSRSKYLDWLDKLHGQLLDLAQTLGSPPSPDLVLPKEVSSMAGVVDVLLKESGYEPDTRTTSTVNASHKLLTQWVPVAPKHAEATSSRAHELAQARSIAKFPIIDSTWGRGTTLIRHALNGMSLPIAFQVMAEHVEDLKKAKPETYWNRGEGMVDPRKHGYEGVSAREQILLRELKLRTKELFGKPHHGVVAILINALLGKQRFSESTVSKAPNSRKI
jgi:hypothetical protein